MRRVILTDGSSKKRTGFLQKSENEQQVRYQELAALQEISQAILNSLDVKTVAETILEKAISIGGFDLGNIRLLDRSGQTLDVVAGRGYYDPENIQRHNPTIDAVTGGLTAQVVALRETRIEEDVQACSGLRTLKREGVRSAIMVPARAGDRVLGVIQLGSRTPRTFQPGQVRLLEAIGNQIGVAVQKARLFEETQQNLERIRALQEIDKAITSTLDLRTVLDVLLEKIDLVLPYSATTIRLFSRESGLLEPVACRNLDERAWKAEEWRGGRGIPNMVFDTKAPLTIGNVQTDPRSRDPDFFRRHRLVSYLGVPLIAKDEILGVLSFYTREQHEFHNEEVEFLSTLAGQAAVAIHNSQLYQEMTRLVGDLARSNRVRDEFLSVMSHELRTPLNVVMGYTGMIKDGLLGEINPEQEKALEKVLSRAGDQLTMIGGILQATQLESEEVKVENREVRLKDVLDDVRSSYQTPLSKEVAFHWDYASDLPVVKTDSEKLKNILHQLINNAIKFTERGSVTVSARIIEGSRQKAVGSKQHEKRGDADGQLPTANYLLDGSAVGRGYVELRVSDTGIGIPSDHFALIFERFCQVDSSETRKYGGVGIGLYIVKKLTEMLRGKVEVESEPGKGSTFTVTIPCES